MEIKNVSFQHAKQAPYFFKNLSFSLEPGQLHALHGQNGVGKTVLLHLMSGHFDRQAVLKGEIICEGVTLVHQRFDHRLADQFTFLENLKFGCLGRFPNPFLPLQGPHFLPDLLTRFHIHPQTPVARLSGGQRQILALLMQLQKKTKALLLDEPTAAMDAENAQMVFEFLQSLEGVTKLVVCHDRELIERYTSGRHLYMQRQEDGLRTLTCC